MKTLHYYARPNFMVFEHEQPNASELANSQVTKEMVLALIREHAIGTPPYDLEVPRSILYKAHCWDIPTTLLTISPVAELENDVSPLTVGILRFPAFQDGVCIVIHARRCVETSDPSTWPSACCEHAIKKGF